MVRISSTQGILDNCRRLIARAWPVVAIAMILVPVFLACGCVSQKPAKTEAPTLTDTRTALTEHAVQTINATERIDKQAEAVKVKAPEAAPEADAIRDDSKAIRDRAHEVAKLSASLKDAEARLSAIVKERDAEALRADKAESERGRMQSRWLAAAGVASALGFGVCVVLFLLGKLSSIVPAAICVGVLLGVIVFDWMLGYAWWIGGAIVLVVVAWTAFQVWVRNKTLKEVVQTVSEAKEAGAIAWDQFTPIANKVQDRITRKFIDFQTWWTGSAKP